MPDKDWERNEWMTQPRNRRAVLGIAWAELGTTLAKAALKKAVPVPATKKLTPKAKRERGLAAYEEREAVRKAKGKLVEDAAPAFAVLLPKDKPTLDLLCAGMSVFVKDGGTPREMQLAIAETCVDELVQRRTQYEDGVPVIAQALLDIAGELKVRLPLSITTAAKPSAAVIPATPKKAAKKGK